MRKYCNREKNQPQDFGIHTSPTITENWILVCCLCVYMYGCVHVCALYMYIYSNMKWFCCCRPNSTLKTLNANEASMWVKVISSWLCLALYSWTLVAPILLPNREFNWTASIVHIFKILRFLYIYYSSANMWCYTQCFKWFQLCIDSQRTTILKF